MWRESEWERKMLGRKSSPQHRHLITIFSNAKHCRTNAENVVNAVKSYRSLVDYTTWWGFLSSLDEFFISTGFVSYRYKKWKFCCFSAWVFSVLVRNFCFYHFSIHNFHIFHRLLNTLNENSLNKCFDLAQWTCWHNLKYKTELESEKFARWKKYLVPSFPRFVFVLVRHVLISPKNKRKNSWFTLASTLRVRRNTSRNYIFFCLYW